jgi:hypothetical protein
MVDNCTGGQSFIIKYVLVSTEYFADDPVPWDARDPEHTLRTYQYGSLTRVSREPEEFMISPTPQWDFTCPEKSLYMNAIIGPVRTGLVREGKSERLSEETQNSAVRALLIHLYCNYYGH